MTSHLNGGHNGQDQGEGENVIRIPTLAERDRDRKEAEKTRARAAHEPLISMPPATKYLLGALLLIHIVLTQLLGDEQAGWVIMNFGFIPAHFTDATFTPLSFLTPLTSMFLHGSWLHLIMNGLMLAAFGSGIEKWLGTKRMLILFVASGLVGAGLHYLLNTGSIFPMIGASGGLSGFFAAALIMINRGQREMGGRWGILPFAVLWIGLSIGFGMMGGPDGSMIAWAAHVGGFLGGFLVLKAMRV